MPGKGFVIGNVTDVVDGETLKLTVDEVGGELGNGYRVKEGIRIHRFRPTDLVWITGALPGRRRRRCSRGSR